MRAAVFEEAGKPMSIKTLDDPAPKINELIIQVKRCGICGTDLHSTEHHETALPSGTVLGHEYAGEVVGMGKEVKSSGLWKEGDKLTGLPFSSCGKCEPCRGGRPFECDLKKIVGMDIGGGFAEYMRIDVTNAVKLPSSISWDEAALVEPLAVGLHAVRRSSKKIDGSRVLVIGAGPIGLAVSYWAKFFGARNVVVSEIDNHRLQSSLKFGATELIDSSREDVSERFNAITGQAPDIIFECVGIPGMVSQCVDWAKFGGEIVIVGFCMSNDSFVPALAVMREVNMRFAIAYHKQDFEFIAELMASDRVNAAHMCSEVIGFDQFADVFESLRKPNQQCKVLLDPFG